MARRRLIFLSPLSLRRHLAAVLALLLLAYPSSAQAQQNDLGDLQAEQVCSTIPDRLSASDIAAIKQQIALFSPVRHADLARRLAIVNVENSSAPDPYVDPDLADKPTIHVPVGFRALQCRLAVAILIYSGMQQLPDAPDWRNFSVRAYMEQCEPRRVGVITCLNRLSGVMMPPTKGGITETLMKIFETASEDAFFHIMLHEFAHLAYAHEERGYRQEYEADLYAGLRMALSRRSAIGALAAYSSLSAGDAYIPTESHGSFACRARLLQSVQASIAPLVSASLSWADGQPKEYRARRNKPPSNASFFRILGDASKCPTDEQISTGPTRKDIQGLVAVMDKDVVQAASTLTEQIDRILATKPVTDEGRMFRMGMISTRIWSASVDDDSPAALRVQLPLVRRVLLGNDSSYIRSDDYGRLIAMAGFMSYELAPPGSSMQQADAALRPQLERAIRYHPRYAIAQLQLGLLAYRQGRCTEGRTHLLNAAEISGDSMNTAQNVSAVLTLEKRNGCTHTSASMAEDWRKMRNWR